MSEIRDAVVNPATAERVTFIRRAANTGGELLEMENLWTRADHRTAPHMHPGMEETWEVIEGRAGFLIGGVEHEAGPGDSVVAPPGVVHVAWNLSGGATNLRVTMRPALRWEEFVERMFAAPERVLELLPEFPEEIAPPP